MIHGRAGRLREPEFEVLNKGMRARGAFRLQGVQLLWGFGWVVLAFKIRLSGGWIANFGAQGR